MLEMHKMFCSGVSTAVCGLLIKIKGTRGLSCLNNLVRINKIDFSTETVKNIIDRKIKFKFDSELILKKHPKSEALLSALRNSEFSGQLMFQIIQEKPEVIDFDPCGVVSNITYLLRLGFEPNRISEMILKYPHLLEFEQNEICDTFETWRKCGLHERFLWRLFETHPMLFAVSDTEVQRRVKRVRYFMVEKINRITNILLNNPGIMYGNWYLVEEKFKYLYLTLRILEKDISRSSALSLPLAHIKLRYSFLEKCGIYVRPKKGKDTGLDVHKNPTLSSVVDTSDEIFAMNVAKVSPEEFEVFKKLMKYEEKVENQNLNVRNSEFDTK